MTTFLFLENFEKKKLNKILYTFENIMENGAFAPGDQMLNFPWYFQIHDI